MMKKLIVLALLAILFSVSAATAGTYIGVFKWKTTTIFERDVNYPIYGATLKLTLEQLKGGAISANGNSVMTFDDSTQYFNPCYGSGYKTVDYHVFIEGTCGTKYFSMYLDRNTLDGEIVLGTEYDFYAYGYLNYTGRSKFISNL